MNFNICNLQYNDEWNLQLVSLNIAMHCKTPGLINDHILSYPNILSILTILSYINIAQSWRRSMMISDHAKNIPRKRKCEDCVFWYFLEKVPKLNERDLCCGKVSKLWRKRSKLWICASSWLCIWPKFDLLCSRVYLVKQKSGRVAKSVFKKLEV